MTQKFEYHQPVLVDEVLEGLRVENAHLKKQGWYVDATLGTGGHTIALLEKGVKVIGIELDSDTLEIAKERINKAFPVQNKVFAQYILIQGNFIEIDTILTALKISNIIGIIVDLGVNSLQLKSSTRGFSFENADVELDMRIDRDQNSVKAKDLLNLLRFDQLMELFGTTLEFPEAKSITESVIKKRIEKPFDTMGDFLNLAEKLKSRSGINPATKALLALRIAVNSELENIQIALPKMMDVIAEGGRLAVISFHSGEDRIVKNTFNDFAKDGLAQIVTNKPILPGLKEVKNNPSARSAKLRIVEKNE
jgi:16S rRNA (cytosine1402-N4)-methyltransferase